jgi:hypothetical protein
MASTTDGARGRARATAAAAGVGILLNIAAVVLLQGQPHCYKPGDLSAWASEALAAPDATLWAAWAFTLGLLSLGCVGPLLARAEGDEARRPALLELGGLLLLGGAWLDAAGTMAPAVAVRFLATPGAEAPFRALLGLSLALDAVFNVSLGLALLLIAGGLSGRWPGWLRGLGALAGLCSLPLAGQLVSDRAAWMLAVSGPLWLVFFAVLSVKLWRRS